MALSRGHKKCPVVALPWVGHVAIEQCARSRLPCPSGKTPKLMTLYVAIKLLASSADLKAHFTKKRSAKQSEDKWSLINGKIFAHRRFPFFNKSRYTYIGRTTGM